MAWFEQCVALALACFLTVGLNWLTTSQFVFSVISMDIVIFCTGILAVCSAIRLYKTRLSNVEGSSLNSAAVSQKNRP